MLAARPVGGAGGAAGGGAMLFDDPDPGAAADGVLVTLMLVLSVPLCALQPAALPSY